MYKHTVYGYVFVQCMHDNFYIILGSVGKRQVPTTTDTDRYG